MTESTFADRLFWSRTRKGLGATLLARAAKCSQGLISQIERKNSRASDYSNAFAKALDVPPHWLATGGGPVPEGFDPDQARRGRETSDKTVIIPPSKRNSDMPHQARFVEPTEPLVGADALMKTIIAHIIDFKGLAGAERTKGLLVMLGHLADLTEGAAGQSQPSGATKKRRLGASKHRFVELGPREIADAEVAKDFEDSKLFPEET